ncbi:glycosyltransferase involved in cell wall biosynthesis [Algoriphagus sp. 4150]|uniref:glycosyltransferase family 4 protein n=1 Tax=Algoriphagus sp. 4150 TaxID=2817756 RepID=UPI002860AB76|nr:glycosyltransferase family 4 protein [Algoriphagus sp. 4150]MDR7130544.1 glycosyltransferase involved in cell wall biosynthesis [Algoriphagus sp. 4150]
MSKKLVGIGIPCLLVGGTEIQTLNLVKALVLENYRVDLICYFEFDPVMVREFEEVGAGVTLLKWPRSLGAVQFIRDLTTIIRTLNPVIFHVQYVAPGALPIVAARFAGVKNILATVHQPKTASHGRFAGMILRSAASLCTSFLSVSKSTEQSWFGSSHVFSTEEHYKKVPAHCTIYNSLDTRAIDLQVSQLSPVKPTDEIIRIGTVCRLNYVKGVDTLIEAFHLLGQKENKRIQLLIYGEGEDEPRLKKMVSDLGLDEAVHFSGKLAPGEVLPATAKMDIVVVPSRFEAFGLYAAEAMCIGKPVVAADTFGLAEVITDQLTGLLFPVENAAKLAEKLERLIQDAPLRDRLGLAARESIKSRFDFSDYKKKVGKLYGLLSDS